MRSSKARLQILVELTQPSARLHFEHQCQDVSLEHLHAQLVTASVLAWTASACGLGNASGWYVHVTCVGLELRPGAFIPSESHTMLPMVCMFCPELHVLGYLSCSSIWLLLPSARHAATPHNSVFGHVAGSVLIESACNVERVAALLCTLAPQIPGFKYFR